MLGLLCLTPYIVACGKAEPNQEESVQDGGLPDGSLIENPNQERSHEGTNDGGNDGGNPEVTVEAPVEKDPEITCTDPFTWPVPKETISVPTSDAWKGELTLPNEPFASFGIETAPRWVKFTILLRDPTKVYFQNSQKFEYHYDFASQHLPP
ncbi:MAG: hypothetical protein KDE20_22970, partial [Caldilineaceae bacterium]|nr:hypothetical protein [Caldilineaceae bacterium]